MYSTSLDRISMQSRKKNGCSRLCFLQRLKGWLTQPDVSRRMQLCHASKCGWFPKCLPTHTGHWKKQLGGSWLVWTYNEGFLHQTHSKTSSIWGSSHPQHGRCQVLRVSCMPLILLMLSWCHVQTQFTDKETEVQPHCAMSHLRTRPPRS